MKTHNRSSVPFARAATDVAPHPDIVAQQAAENEGWPVATFAPFVLFHATPWRWHFRLEPVDNVPDASAVRVRSWPSPIST